MNNIERMLNPKEHLDEIKECLINIYKEDYGEKNLPIIRQRINGTFMFFESPPNGCAEFISMNSSSFHNIDRYHEESIDYVNKMIELERRLTSELFTLYAIAFNLSPEDSLRLTARKEEFVNLPIENLLIGLNTPEKLFMECKTSDNKIWKQYIRKCDELGIRPIVDTEVIEELIRLKKQKERRDRSELITHTLWGQRINREFDEAMGNKIYPGTLSDIIYGPPCNIRINTENKNLLYFPMTQQYYVGNLDATFLHEGRHMVEYDSNISASGLSYRQKKYPIFNELRVEKHAIEDNERTEVIFSKEPYKKTIIATYRELLHFSDNFFTEYQHILDELAFKQNITQLEKIFGEQELGDYENFLSEKFDSIKSLANAGLYQRDYSEQEEKKNKQYIKSLENNAKKYNMDSN